MKNDKCFCIDCETLQRETTKCLKCGSLNVFYMGSKTRFHKNPKPRDYEEVFNYLLIWTQNQYGWSEKLRDLYDYVCTHKFSKTVYNNTFKTDVTFKNTMIEMYENVINREANRKMDIPKDKVNSPFEGLTYIGQDEANKVNQFLTVYTHNMELVQGWAIPFYEGVLTGSYIPSKNPFKPKKVSIKKYNNCVFKDKKASIAFSHFVASKVIEKANDISDYDEIPIELLDIAKKHVQNCKYTLNKDFSEYMI